MKIMFVLFLILLTSAGINAEQKEHDLQLSTNILKQSYCKDENSGTIMLLLRLHLRYTNVGRGTVILYKGSDLISYVRVARNREALSAKNYEVDMSVTWVTSGDGNVPNTGRTPDSRFVVLKPGAAYKAVGETRIIDSNALAAGERAIQVIVSTWHGSGEQAEKLRGKWRKAWHFWYGNTFSEPMLLAVESSPKMGRC